MGTAVEVTECVDLLKKLFEEEYHVISKLVANNKLQNVYIYIDSIEVGFNSDNSESYVMLENKEIAALVFIYCHSIQLMEFKELPDEAAKEIADFIIRRNIIRVSGNSTLVQKVGKYLNCRITYGYVMEFNGKEYKRSQKTIWATEADLPKIAELICTDDSIGISYTFDNLYSQLSHRMLYEHCRNMIIKKNGEIAAHMATYAEIDKIAVLGGLITDPKYRGLGLGSILVKELSSEMRYTYGKTTLLYCFEEKYRKWYEKLGYSVVNTTAKIDVNTYTLSL